MCPKIQIMKKTPIIDLHSPMQRDGSIECVENTFYIFNLSSNIKLIDYPFMVDMFVCCICSQGETKGRINLIPYTLKGPGIAINTPGQLLENESISSDFQAICILISKDFITNLGLPYNFHTYMSVQENPVLSVSESQFDALMSYCSMVRRLFKVDHPNKLDIIKHLTCAFFYGIGYYFHQTAETKSLTNEEALMQHFLKEVQLSYKRERKVLYYADRLHLSPGYLSTLIKNFSGKTAAEWIDDYVVLEAKALLKSTNMTIQQISDELNFPSQSFFGKYFKRQTGVSPKEYKNK